MTSQRSAVLNILIQSFIRDVMSDAIGDPRISIRKALMLKIPKNLLFIGNLIGYFGYDFKNTRGRYDS